LTLEGGCHCGAVRYEIACEPGFSFFCQCRDCQRFSGSGHMANIVFPATAVSLTGKTATYRYAGGSGNPVLSVFCPACGAPVYGHPEGAEIRIVRASSLDDPGLFAPTKVVYSDSAQPWDALDANAPRFAETGGGSRN
jgi:hypothetical protein